MDVLGGAALVLFLGLVGLYAWFRLVCPWREQNALRALGERTGLAYVGRRVMWMPRRGRVFGAYRGRACAVECHTDQVETEMRVACAVDNPSGCSFRILAAGGDLARPGRAGNGAGQPLWVAQSTPPGYAERAIADAGLAAQIPPVAAEIGAPAYQLLLIGHLLRLEYHPVGTCALPVPQLASGLHDALDALCACADRLETIAPLRGLSGEAYAPVDARQALA
ncbi:MAG: hypothetical protein JXA09_08795 [Anaerolineae bacterium]|nr:hypothetical protein [Anaerolineae bacterium]